MDLTTATDNYFIMIGALAQKAPTTLLAVFFLSLGRLVPIMVLAPFLAARQLPTPIKIMLAISILILIFPQIIFSLNTELNLNIHFAGLMIKEILIGFILGFIAAIPFYIAQASGSLIDHIRGSASLQVSDPTTQTQTGPIGILYNYILIVIFFAIGGPILFFDAISSSFSIMPINQLLSPFFFNAEVPFWKTIIGMIAHLMRLAVQLGAPSLIGILMAEMFLGIANRLAPQVQIVFLGISLKSFTGLTILATAWFFILHQFGRESMIWLKELTQTIQSTGFYKLN